MPIPTPISDPVLDGPQTTTKPSPSPPSPLPFNIQIFPSHNLLQQPFLPELKEVINASYADHISKHGLRLQSDTQIVTDVGENGFTAIATATTSGEIVGTASVKPWVSSAGEIIWRPAGWYDGVVADEIVPGQLATAGTSKLGVGGCEGDYEILLVAVKPGVRYRKKGIAEGLVKACEGEIGRRVRVEMCSGSGSVSGEREGERAGKTKVKIMLKVVREINGEYWTKKGFRVAGECYCPPFTWDLKVAFVLWAMGRELVVE